MFSQIKFLVVTFVAFFSSIQAFGSFASDMEEGGFVGPDSMNTEVSCRLAMAPAQDRMHVEIQSGGIYFRREAVVTQFSPREGERNARVLVKREPLKVGYRYISKEKDSFILDVNFVDPVRPGLYEGQLILGVRQFKMLCRQMPVVTSDAEEVSAQ